MRLLICGDRDWDDEAYIRNFFKWFITKFPITRVIHGAARGADEIAGKIAKEFNIPVSEFPANWGEHGRAAGPIRNRCMLIDGKPHMVIAFHANIAHSKGTKDMIEQANRAGTPVWLYSGIVKK